MLGIFYRGIVLEMRNMDEPVLCRCFTYRKYEVLFERERANWVSVIIGVL